MWVQTRVRGGGWGNGFLYGGCGEVCITGCGYVFTCPLKILGEDTVRVSGYYPRLLCEGVVGVV